MERAAPLTDRRGRSGSRRSVRSTKAEEWSQDRLEHGRTDFARESRCGVARLDAGGVIFARRAVMRQILSHEVFRSACVLFLTFALTKRKMIAALDNYLGWCT
jgi:hypothetical protein